MAAEENVGNKMQTNRATRDEIESNKMNFAQPYPLTMFPKYGWPSIDS